MSTVVGALPLESSAPPLSRPVALPRFAVRWLHRALVAFVAALAFANSLGNYFMLDDYWLLDWCARTPWREVVQPYKFGGSEDYARFWFNASRLAGKSGEGYFRPSVSILYKGVADLFGMDARAFHGSSILLHVIISLLVLWVAGFFFLRREVALVVALAFAAHPAHSETVQWLGANTYLLVAPFYLAALAFFLRSRRPGASAWNYAAAFLCFPLGLGGHELAITLPAILLAADLWANFARGEESGPFTRLTWRHILLRQVPFGALGLAYLAWHAGVLATISQDMAGSTYAHDATHPLTFALSSLFQFTYGLVHLLLPFPFAPVDAEDFVPSLGAPALAAVCLLALLVSGWACSRLGGRSRRALFAALLFIVPFAPALLVAPTERQLYLPSVGFCLLLGLGYERLAVRGRAPRRMTTALVLAGVALAWTYNVMWSFPSGIARTQLAEIRREAPEIEPGSSVYLLNLWGPSFGLEMMPSLLYRDPTLDVQVLTIHPKLLPVGEHRVNNAWLQKFFSAALPDATGEAPVETTWESPDVLRVQIRGGRFMRSLIEQIYPAAPIAQTPGGRVETPRFTAEVVAADADGVETLRFRFQPGAKRIVFDLQGGRVRRL